MRPEELQENGNCVGIAEERKDSIVPAKLAGAKARRIQSGGKEAGTSTSSTKRRPSTTGRCHILEAQGFIVGKTLGAGSYATVKSAYDVNRKHKVAIKVINKKKAYDEYLEKFLPREIESMKTLSHPRLVTFYQIIETTSRYFFAMELLENGDLLEFIKANKYVDEVQAGIWFRQLQEGLTYMHNNLICHRDIKCENLLLDSEKNLKITDFGFSRKAGKTKSGDPILSKTYCGSYAYAPPEILKGISYDPFVAEVWSMGVVLFTMVYGRLPFDDSDHKKLVKQVQSKVVFPRKPIVSNQCRILILKMLTKTPGRVPLKSLPADPWFKSQVILTGEDTLDNDTSEQNGQTEEALVRSSFIQSAAVESSA